jgi:hypothetical protein
MAPKDVVPKPPTSPRPPETPLSSPALLPYEQVLIMKHVQQFLKLLKAVQANQTLPAPEEASQPATSEDKPPVAIRASKLEFKTVNEM